MPRRIPTGHLSDTITASGSSGAQTGWSRDDVVQHMRFLAGYRVPESGQCPGIPERQRTESTRLTGRKTQREINEIRDKLEKTLPDQDVISVLLATSMISVGIDIDRLALMAVKRPAQNRYGIHTGSPERVGRRQASPGGVFVLLNPYKPRDLSHYENFVGFHNTMQKHVEPSTLTPFFNPGMRPCAARSPELP